MKSKTVGRGIYRARRYKRDIKNHDGIKRLNMYDLFQFKRTT